MGKVTDNNTGYQYELKRVHQLIGTLIKYGQIEFERDYRSKKREIFLYDTKTGYFDDGQDLKIGDQVIFEVTSNKFDNDSFHYDAAKKLIIGRNQDYEYTVHSEMFAFNVKRAGSEQCDVENGQSECKSVSNDNNTSIQVMENKINSLNPNAIPFTWTPTPSPTASSSLTNLLPTIEESTDEESDGILFDDDDGNDADINTDNERIEDLQKSMRYLQNEITAAKKEIESLKAANRQQSVQNKAYKKFVEKFKQNPNDLSLHQDAQYLLNGSYGSFDLMDKPK